MKSIFKFFAYVALIACALYGFCCLVDKYVCKYADIDEEECSDECICTQVIRKIVNNYRNEVNKLQRPAEEEDFLD